MQGKVCGRCHERKPLNEFHRDASSKKDGVGRICKGCKLEYCRTKYGRMTREEYRIQCSVLRVEIENDLPKWERLLADGGSFGEQLLPPRNKQYLGQGSIQWLKPEDLSGTAP